MEYIRIVGAYMQATIIACSSNLIGCRADPGSIVGKQAGTSPLASSINLIGKTDCSSEVSSARLIPIAKMFTSVKFPYVDLDKSAASRIVDGLHSSTLSDSLVIGWVPGYRLVITYDSGAVVIYAIDPGLRYWLTEFPSCSDQGFVSTLATNYLAKLLQQ